jgi:hypothetical protein
MVDKFKKQTFPIIILTIVLFLSSNLGYAKKWDVYPSMSRLEIQAIIDLAKNHDTILFHEGTYDFSDLPLNERVENIGAINIIDKTLNIKGQIGNIIIGPDSENGAGGGTQVRGVNAFYIQDLDLNNDITFDGLCVQNFLRGIAIHYCINWDKTQYPNEPDISIPNMRNVTVKNCVFSDIHRQSIALSYVTGNIQINKNEISGNKMGIMVDWYWSEGHQDWQPNGSHVSISKNNIMNTGTIYNWPIGILIMKSSRCFIKENNIDNRNTGIYVIGIDKGAQIFSNTLTNSDYGIYIKGYSENGISIKAEKCALKKNKMYNISLFGVGIVGDECFGHKLIHNEINTEPNSIAGIYSNTHDNRYIENTIDGSGLVAFYLTSGDYSQNGGTIIYAHNESIEYNIVKDFSAGYCHYYLHNDTHDNKLIGTWEENVCYIDNGYNNEIIDIYPCSGESSVSTISKTTQSQKFNLKKLKTEMKNQIEM